MTDASTFPPYPDPLRDENGEVMPHTHCGPAGVDDPLCYPCFDVGYDAAMDDAALVLGTTPEFIRSLVEGSGDLHEQPSGPARRYFLYRLFGAGDRLLYVGITRNLAGRLKAHRRAWGDVLHRVEHEEHPTHLSVLAAEAEEIAMKCPPFNSVGVGR